MKLNTSILGRLLIFAAFGICATALAGCGDSDSQSAEPSASVEELAAVESQAELKSLLQSVADSGEGGSALAGVGSSIESLPLDDARKQTLLKDFEQLNSETDPAKIKAIATRMASSL